MMKKLYSILQAFVLVAFLFAPFTAIAGGQDASKHVTARLNNRSGLLTSVAKINRGNLGFSTLGMKPVGLHFHIVLRDKNGKILAVRDPDDLDLITNTGATVLLNDTFGGTSTANWYMGEVTGASAPTFAVGDTMAVHLGWTEEVSGDWTNATRPAITPIASGPTVGGGVVTAVMTAAVFNQNSSITLQGLYVTDSNTKAGTTGNLYGELPFPSFSVVATNTVTITVSIITVPG